MADQDLNIRLNLIDRLSGALSRVQGNLSRIGQTVDDVGKKFEATGKHISRVGNTLTTLGASVTAPLILAFNQSAQVNLQYANTLERIKISFENLSLSVASSVAPVMDKLANIVQKAVNVWNSIPQVTRDSIIQYTLLAGILLTVVGVFTTLIGKVVAITGVFIRFLALGNGFGAILVALVAMVMYWDKVGNVVRKVLDAIETGLTVLQIGFIKLEKGVITMLANIVGKLVEVYALLARAPGPQQNVFLALSEGAGKLQANLAGLAQKGGQDIAALEQHLADLFSGKGGMLSTGMDGIIEKARATVGNVMNYIKNAAETTSQSVQKTMDVVGMISQKTATAMSSAMADGFFNIMKGQFQNLQDVAVNFGNSILQILAQVIAKWLLVKTLGAAMPGLIPFFHEGGVVRRAHSGYLASDEVPIIAQAGEGIISRKGMQALGQQNFNDLNQGRGGKSSGGGGGISLQVVLPVSAMDSTDVMRRRKDIANAVSAEIANNAQIRDIVRRYR